MSSSSSLSYPVFPNENKSGPSLSTLLIHTGSVRNVQQKFDF